ncbi:MAG: TonB-dependent receptor [Flavobacteriales bacterium]
MERSLRTLLTGLLFIILANSSAQEYSIRGVITDPANTKPLSGVEVMLVGTGNSTSTATNGSFTLKRVAPGRSRIRASYMGHGIVDTVVVVEADLELDLLMPRKAIDLREVNVTPRTGGSGTEHINALDMNLRPVNNSQDLLQLVPGLFIAQHAGGGKAEQIFFRGFDIDHGTDLQISVDGMPVNMVSHAHGQGYADLHFTIPETMDELELHKGPYDARFGDFATSGTVLFRTKNFVDKNMLKVEYGMFNTKRVVGMFDLLGQKHLLSKRAESAYIAAEYASTDAYFQQKQDFGRVNIFGKYTGQLSDRSHLTVSASTFGAAWNASGQVPDRAVQSGLIDRYGAIDATEGGNTSRTNVNMILHNSVSNSASIKNQLYYVKYDFQLFSNFTFFAEDSVRGDMIAQTDDRSILGYSATYHQDLRLFDRALTFNSGIGLRYDRANIALKNAVQRVVYDTIVAGSVAQLNSSAYLDATLAITDRFNVNIAARLDVFNFDYSDTKEPNGRTGMAMQQRVSPKLNFNYEMNDAVQLYLRTGMGFHSNDARAVVVGNASRTLPKAYGADLGSTFKPAPRILVNAALWTLYMESELVYVGDAGVVETSDPTQRMGAELSVRYQLTNKLFADIDVNYTHGRLVGIPEGENAIPLAPSFTTIGGLAYKQDLGINCSLRYRHIADRPANEDNSVVAQGYFLIDAVTSYKFRKWEIGASVENLLNAEWNQAQFDTQSRLPGENEAISELHYTPGTPLFVKGFLVVRF